MPYITYGDDDYCSGKVTLTLEEFWVAVDAVKARQLESNASGRNHATTYERSYITRLNEEITGAVGELAFAKWLGLDNFSPSVNTFHDVLDVADYEVRSTTGGRTLNLLVRDNDADDRKYVFVTLPPETAKPEEFVVRIRGWMYGSEAKQDKYRDNPMDYRPCYKIPRQDLCYDWPVR